MSIPEPFTFAMGQSIDQRGKCYADYVETPCSVVQRWLNSGVGEHAPWDNTTTQWVKYANNGRGGLVLHVYRSENGYYGFHPTSTSNWARPKLQQRGSMADSASEEETQQKQGPYINFAKIKWLANNGMLWNPEMKKSMVSGVFDSFLNNPNCVNTYKDLGLDLYSILDKGFDVAPIDFVSNSNYRDGASQLKLTEGGFAAARRAGSEPSAEAATIANTTDGKNYVKQGGSPLLLLGSGAFSQGRNQLAVVLAHELAHIGGIGGRALGWFEKQRANSKSGPHDLDKVKGWENVIDACTSSIK